MTLQRVAIAGACFLTITIAVYTNAKHYNDPNFDVRSEHSENVEVTHFQAPSLGSVQTPRNEEFAQTVSQSPFFIKTNETINYSLLSDYRHLLDTLTRIDNADETLIIQWIENAAVNVELRAASRIVNQALFQKLSALQPSSTISWIEQRSATMSNYLEDVLLSDALTGYLEVLPEEAEKWLATMASDGSQQLLVDSLTSALGRLDPQRMLAKLSHDTDQSDAHSIVSQWAYSDPAAALEWLDSHATDDERVMHEGTILENLMLQNPQAALAYVQNSPISEQHTWLLSQYASILAQSEPEAALDWVFAQNDSQLLEQALTELVWNWPKDDLEYLQARIEGIQDPATRERVLVNTASRQLDIIAEDDPGALMTWLDSQNVSIQRHLRPQAISIWMDQDASGAVQWLQLQPDSEERRNLLETVMWQLPTVDIDLALDTFATVRKSVKIALVGPMIQALQQVRPSMVQQWISELDDRDTQNIAATLLNDQIVLSNPDQFLAELDQTTGKERLEKLVILYRSPGSANSELFDQWISDNPLTMTEEMALQRQIEEFYLGMGGHC